MSKQTDFISKMAPLVQAERKKRDKWVLPSVCIAQAILETGWGASSLMSKANAFFGIKATKSWKGKVYSSKTKECYDGINFTTETACFRAYDSLADSVADYFDLICKSSRYKAAVNNSDAKATITAIKNGGYATDPDYASKIMNLINTYNLTQYDHTVKSITEIAEEVIKGKWGNGKERKERLNNAGYNYVTVQKEVNKLLAKPKEPLKSIMEIAKEVIKGKWGDGEERKRKLKDAGYDYEAVQSCVNSLLK